MLEFLNDCGNISMARRGKCCENSLKAFDPYTPMASLFETTLKTIFFRYYPEKKFDKSFRISLNAMLLDEDFRNRYASEYFFDSDLFQIINEIRKISNDRKHSSSLNNNTDFIFLKKAFNCLFNFCAGYYKKCTGNDKPLWSDEEFQVLFDNTYTEEELLLQKNKYLNEISDLNEKLQISNQNYNNICLEAENLRIKLADAESAYVDKDELNNLKIQLSELNQLYIAEKEQGKKSKFELAKTINDKKNIEISLERLKRDYNAGTSSENKLLQNKINKLETMYGKVCEDANNYEKQNKNLEARIDVYKKKIANLEEKIEKLIGQTKNSPEISSLNDKLKIAEKQISNIEKSRVSLQEELINTKKELAKYSLDYSLDSSEFQNAAIDSAAKYYKYLDEIKYENAAGFSEENATSLEKVFSLKNDKYWVGLKLKPYSMDSLLIQVENRVYAPEEIKPILYDEEKHALKVSVSEEFTGVFDNVDVENIKVLSDMKFLVARVGKWYINFGNELHLPQLYENVKEADYSFSKQNATTDQIEAVKGILNNPLTYIWGAPGTGKTQFVLSRAVLSYINAGKKVLVTAPTNNAVEQTLRGLLPMLDAAGIDYNDKVIRYGTASSDFYKEFPGVCEETDYSKELENTKSEIKEISEEIIECDSCIDLFVEYDEYVIRKNKFNNILGKLPDFAEQINKFEEKRNFRNTIVNEKIECITIAKKNIESFKSDIKKADSNVISLRKKLDGKSIAKIFGLIDTEKIKHELLTELNKIEDCNRLVLLTQSEIEKYENEIKSAESDYANDCKNFDLLRTGLISIYNDFPSISKMLLSMNYENCLEVLKDIKQENERLITLLSNDYTKFEKIQGKKKDEFLELHKKLQDKLEILKLRQLKYEASFPQKNENGCQVIAATLDNCISKLLPNDLFFDHAFLDEAAYAPLIKAGVLFAYGCPVTFLGDHMQLPPVCECDKFDSPNEPITLWAQSAIHAEEIFSLKPKEIYNKYIKESLNEINKEPNLLLKNMRQFNLTNSHRFGRKLADVLAGDVYDKNFKGNSEDTEIFYIDAKAYYGDDPRENLGESLAIKEYLKTLNKEELADCGVLTAYVKQKKQIQKDINPKSKFAKENVLNVHRSQGREWKTIILSVTDKNNMFFTNSATLTGKRVINTAVSRAKKKLIIVCDYNYWRNKDNQLIGKFLNIAEEIKLNISYSSLIGKPNEQQKVIPEGIDQKRLYRARKLKVEAANSKYSVSGENLHIVTEKNGNYYCDCKDFSDGVKFCKHVLAVMLYNKIID